MNQSCNEDSSKIFEGVIVKNQLIIDWEPVSNVHYTRYGSRIRQPTQNLLATKCHVNWPVVYPESSSKIMDPVSAALPQNLWRIFVATLEQIRITSFYWLQHFHLMSSPLTLYKDLLRLMMKIIEQTYKTDLTRP